jgi:sporulation protein YlmC with PRC-barrel domain
VKSQVYPNPHNNENGDTIKMSKVFARNLLFNKQVMATDGTEIGALSNIVIEIKGGNIIDLMITPNPNFDASRYKKVDNYILMPFNSVSAIKDYIIVDKLKARA